MLYNQRFFVVVCVMSGAIKSSLDICLLGGNGGNQGKEQNHGDYAGIPRERKKQKEIKHKDVMTLPCV